MKQLSKSAQQHALKSLREKVKIIDSSIIKKLALRQKIIKKIGNIKLQSGKKVVDINREKKLYQHYAELAAECQLSPKFVRSLFKLIILHSRKQQAKIIKSARRK